MVLFFPFGFSLKKIFQLAVFFRLTDTNQITVISTHHYKARPDGAELEFKGLANLFPICKADISVASCGTTKPY